MSIVSKRRNIFTSASASSGGSGVQSVNSGTDITVDNTDPANPIINFTGTYQDPITVVANYSALPTASTVTGEFYWCSASQGTAWLPGSLGGTYYSAGLYYSNGSSWEFMSVPYQATQTEVNTGTNSDKFVTPNTLFNSSKWSNFVPYTGATSDVDLGARILSAQSLQVTGTNGAGHIHLRHQASDATATGQTTALFANSNGDLKYKNAGNYYTTFATSANTANRVYTFPNADGTVALTSNLSSYVPTSRTLTINGTAYDLSADRSWTVSSGITVGTTTITSGTSGRIAFNNGGVYGEDAGITYSSANKRLTLGGTTATIPLIARNSTWSTNFIVNSNNGRSSGAIGFWNDALSAAMRMSILYRTEFSIVDENAGSANMYIFPSSTYLVNQVSIKTGSAPTAHLHIAAGTATAGNAPLKLTAGTNLTTPENGTFEYDGTNLYFTVGGVRKTVSLV